jgi:hypothetical protein
MVTKIDGEEAANWTDDRWTPARGPIALIQTHQGGGFKFHKIEIKELPPPEPAFQPLFNGKDLTGWVPQKGTDPANVWDITGPFVICKGSPGKRTGYLRSTKAYENYVLKFDWRCPRPAEGPPIDRAFNSIVRLHMEETPADSFKDLELKFSNDATGWLMPFGGAGFRLVKLNELVNPMQQAKGAKLQPKNKPFGEWNAVTITSRNGTLEIVVNSEHVATVADCRPQKGFIGFQAEGAEIHFRNIELKELPPSAPPESAFQPLFNGKDLEGWAATGHATSTDQNTNWKADAGILRYKAKNLAGGLETVRQYGNYRFEMEWRFPDRGDVLAKTKDPSVEVGFHALYNAAGSMFLLKLHQTGTGQFWPFGVQGTNPDKKRIYDLRAALNAWGEWNHLAVTCAGDTIDVEVNGKPVWKATDCKPQQGAIVLKCGNPEPIEFRNLKIKPLAGFQSVPGFQPLFNSKDLAGWHVSDTHPGWWTVKDGILTGRLVDDKWARTVLVSDRNDLLNFHARIEMKVNNGGITHVMVHGKPPSYTPNEMFLRFDGRAPADSMGVTVRRRDAEKALARFEVDTAKLRDQWFTLEIIARDPEITYCINGKEVAHVDDVRFQPGHLGLDVVFRDTVLSVRKLEIKELPPTDRGFVPLFNGKDFAGWDCDRQCWSYNMFRSPVCISALNKTQRLTSQEVFENFELRFQAMESGLGFGVLEFRGDDKGAVGMSFRRKDKIVGAGGLTGTGELSKMIRKALDNGVDRSFKGTGYNHYSIRCVGKRVTIQVNGITTVDEEFAMMPARGRLSWRTGSGAAPNEWVNLHLRDVVIQRLPPEPGFVPLFNGKDFGGWIGNDKNWHVKDKTLIFKGNGPSYLGTDKPFENYVIRFEHWVEAGAEQKPSFELLLHVPTEDESSIKDRERPRIQFNKGGGGLYGSCDYKERPLQALRPFLDKKAKANGWSQVEIHNVDGQIEIICNGQDMAVFAVEKARKGFIGLKPSGGEWSFRNIQINVLPPNAKPPRGAFRPLFPAKNLDGWQGQTGECAWGANGLKITASQDGPTGVWSKQKLRDYEVKFQLQFKEVNCDFKVFPRVDKYSRTDHPPAALWLGFAQFVAKDTPTPNTPASRHFNRSEFNDVAIRCVGKRVTVRLNGEIISDEDIPGLAAEGGLGFHIAAPGRPDAVLRNLEIREFPQAKEKEATFMPLFNGKDLEGWDGDATVWTWKDGKLVGDTQTMAGPFRDCCLFSKQRFRDFELKFRVRTHNPGGIFHGVGLRCEPQGKGAGPNPRGPEVAIGKNLGGFYTVSGIGKYLKQPKDKANLDKVAKAGFNDFHVRCVGKHVTITVNGLTTIDDDFPDIPDDGLIAFHVLRFPEAENWQRAEFEDIQIRELPANK